MGRPCKEKLVAVLPKYTCFKPNGIPLQKAGEIVLSIEEMEALRLADIERLEQAEAAAIMTVSKPTFNRTLSGARSKVAQALWNGAALRIGGGNYRLGCRHRLGRCFCNGRGHGNESRENCAARYESEEK